MSANAGRLEVYALLGASAGAVPLPWVPEIFARSVRGALVHDVATRQGLSLSPEARDVLAAPHANGASRPLFVQALRFIGSRVALRALAAVGPIRLVRPLRGALRTYVLGRLLSRYIDVSRTEGGIRIGLEEATRIRSAIDGAWTRALSVAAEDEPEPLPVEDERDPTTAFVDGLLGMAAGLPSRLLHRLDAAFDDIMAAHP
ncbi:MAG: hypothetical protein ABSC94_01075 [Polyangiaceae bacterium]|jgi:hypothetical protein